MLEHLWLVALGAAAGTLGSMIGLGGGILVVPALTFVGFPPSAAAANSLFAAFSNSVASTISYSKQRRIEYRLGAFLGLLCVPGTVLGAAVSGDVSPGTFGILFALVLVASAAYILMRKSLLDREARTPAPPHRADHPSSKTVSMSGAVIVLAAAASLFAGVISSFFGIGGGTVFVPLMVAVMGLAMRRAAPTSQFVLLFASFSGLAAHSAMGHPDFVQALYLAIGAFAGGLAGARISTGVGERRLRIMASVVMIAAAAKLVLDSVGGGEDDNDDNDTAGHGGGM